MKRLNILLLITSIVGSQFLQADVWDNIKQSAQNASKKLTPQETEQTSSNTNTSSGSIWSQISSTAKKIATPHQNQTQRVGGKDLKCSQLTGLGSAWAETEATQEALESAKVKAQLTNTSVIDAHKEELKNAHARAQEILHELDNAKKECGITR